MSDLRVGAVIDRYIIEGRLGQGGMAVVYKVRHKDLDSLHALKVLTVHSESIRQRLHQEGKAQAKLRHSNIVSVTDLVDVNGAPGLIMECVEGPDLSRVLPLIEGDLDLVDTLARGIISGVLEAHRVGLVHRDLKPGNILIAKQGDNVVPKITDFGLVKVLLADADGPNRTQAGSTMGTPAYMAPEQIRDPSLVDARADLFSLGVILYELACGTKPFPGGDILTIFTAIAAGDYVPPRELNPDIPARMERAIIGALEVDLERRIPDCRVLFEVWEGRLVDWTQVADKPDAGDKPQWDHIVGTDWHDRAEQSNSMTAVPSSLEPGVPPSTAPVPVDDGSTVYPDEPLDEDTGSPPPGQHAETYYDDGPLPEESMPSRAVVPDAPPGTESPEDPTGARKKSPLPWVLGLGALAVAAVAGVFLIPDDPPPSDTTSPIAAPTEPPATVEPGPEPEDAVAEPEDAMAEPEPAPAPVPRTIAVARPAPEPVATVPEPEPDPEPVFAPEPVAAPTTATVAVEGGIRVWLVGSEGRFPPGEVPPGSYTIKAFFDPMQPLDAGSFSAKAGDTLTVKCSTAMARCTAAPS